MDLYAEKYMEKTPEQQEYIQIHGRNDRYLYTASHESYARLHELGDMYEDYFGKPPKENYFIKYQSFKDFPVKYDKYVLPIKTLKHMAMEEKLEVGMFIPEYAGKKFKTSPILTSVRGGPAEDTSGALTEATIDVNPAVRIYAIVMHIEDDSETRQDYIVISKRSRYNDCIKQKYHAFDFEWKNMIIKAFDGRESACNDKKYGELFEHLFRLNDVIVKSKTPYCWRYGMDDSYGFSKLTFSDSVGCEIDISTLELNYHSKPKNLRLMAEPHPSAVVKIDKYEMVPLVP